MRNENGILMHDPYLVQFRRGGRFGLPKAQAEQLDGKTFRFSYGWQMTSEDGGACAGEAAMIPQDPTYPRDAPGWIASGDLHLIPEQAPADLLEEAK